MGFAYADIYEYVNICRDTAGPIAPVLQGLPEDERERIGEELKEGREPFAAADGYELPGRVLAAVAGELMPDRTRR